MTTINKGRLMSSVLRTIVVSAPARSDNCLGRARAVTLAVASLFAVAAVAQQPTGEPAPASPSASGVGTVPGTSPDTGMVESITVTGQRASLRKSIAIQRDANNIVSAVSADDIGQLPDKNAAEALARVPGVSVQRDQGEGRYVTIRGTGPDLNAVTINGAAVPSPEASRRAVSLDVLPAGLVGSLEVQKTLTPDQDANSLGGTVEVKTLTAFDVRPKLFSIYADGSYDENSGKTSPSGGILWADRFVDGTLGVAFGLSLERRKFGSDDVETGGAWTGGRLSGWELRDYHPERTRDAAGLNIDYRPGPGRSLYLHTLVSRFSDDEIRDRLTISNIAGGGATEGQSVTARGERRLRQRKYTREIDSAVGGGEYTTPEWKFEASGGWSRATEDTPEQLNDARFRGTSNFSGVGFVDTVTPTLFGPDALGDPASYALNAITFQQRASRDRITFARADLTRYFAWQGADAELKFGAKISRREKTNDTEQWAFNSNNPSSPNYWGPGSTSLAAYVRGPLDFPWGTIGPGIDPELVRAKVAGLNREAARNLAESVLADYRMNEDIDAGYLQLSTTHNGWNVLAGIRNERTDFRANGNQVSGGAVTPVEANHRYDNWLPSVQTRLDLNTDTALRAAWTNSLVRANFDQLAPAISFSSATEATVGNPSLKPLQSSNFDLGVERQLGRDGVVSAYLFAKYIQDFSYATNLAGTGPWAGYTTVTGYANGDKARVYGIELAYYQALHSLPRPWNGLLVGFNATLLDARATISRYDKPSASTLSRDIALPYQSDRVCNLMLGYETEVVSTRLALNYKSPYLLSVGSDIMNATQDLHVDAQWQVDFSFKYQLAKSLQLVFEAVNLNNEHYYVYQGSRPYNAQYEQYGRTYKLGLKVTL